MFKKKNKTEARLEERFNNQLEWKRKERIQKDLDSELEKLVITAQSAKEGKRFTQYVKMETIKSLHNYLDKHLLLGIRVVGVMHTYTLSHSPVEHYFFIELDTGVVVCFRSSIFSDAED